MLTKVQADGVTTEGESITIFDNAGASDQGITEAPSLVKSRKGKYFLFFSTGCFSGSNYTQWFATADKIEGPYTRAPAPMYTTGDIVDGKALLSPGGGSIYWDAHHFVFHADNPTQGNRGMWDALVDLIGDSVDTGLQTNRTISKKRSVAY